jgi:hypothetical protein
MRRMTFAWLWLCSAPEITPPHPGITTHGIAPRATGVVLHRRNNYELQLKAKRFRRRAQRARCRLDRAQARKV